MGLRNWMVALALVLVAVVAVGCDVDTDTTIYPNGAGKTIVTMTMDAETMAMMEAMSAGMGGQGGGLPGVDGADASMVDTSMVVTQYFADVTGNNENSDGEYTWTKNEDGGYTLSVLPSMESINQLEEQMNNPMLPMGGDEDPLEKMNVKWAYTLPGEIKDTNLDSKDGRTAWIVTTARKLKDGEVEQLKDGGKFTITCGPATEAVLAEQETFMETLNTRKEGYDKAKKAAEEANPEMGEPDPFDDFGMEEETPDAEEMPEEIPAGGVKIQPAGEDPLKEEKMAEEDK